MSTQRNSALRTSLRIALVMSLASFSTHAADIPVLPTVEVHAQATILRLPVVTVRPSAAEIAAARAPELAAVGASSTLTSSKAERRAPHVSFDMPYYSFGKMLPHIGKSAAQ